MTQLNCYFTGFAYVNDAGCDSKIIWQSNEQK